jgi:hypothetical protein
MKYQTFLFATMTMTACSAEYTLYSCKSGGGIDREKLEAQVKKHAESQVGDVMVVECPAKPPTGAGTSFECAVTLQSGAGVYPMQVSLDKDGYGSMAWKEHMMGGRPLEDAIAASFDAETATRVRGVDCDRQLLFARPDSRVRCGVNDGTPGIVEAWLVGDDLHTAYRPAKTWNPETQRME